VAVAGGKLLLKGEVRDGQRVVLDADGDSGELKFRVESAVAAA